MRRDLPTRPSRSGCRARGTSPQPPTLRGALARTAANTAPGIPAHPAARFAQNTGCAISAAGPELGPPPAAASTHPRRHPLRRPPSLPQRPARASLTCTANQSTASRAPEAAAELAPAGECSALFREAPRRERQKEESDGRLQSLGGRRRRRRRRRRRTSRARLQGVPPSSPLLCSSRRRSLPGLWFQAVFCHLNLLLSKRILMKSPWVMRFRPMVPSCRNCPCCLVGSCAAAVFFSGICRERCLEKEVVHTGFSPPQTGNHCSGLC
ncbi:uncharacterized protein RBU33_011317 [Hipposideros larvatus]